MKYSVYYLLLIASIVGAGLPSCTTIIDDLPGVYALDILQGNVIDQDMIDQLRPKMTKRQVLHIMGNPMLVDVFHPNRWNYIYITMLDGVRVQKEVLLFFNDDELIALKGDFQPSTLAVTKPSNKITLILPKRDLDRTWWGKIKRSMADKNPISTDNK